VGIIALGAFLFVVAARLTTPTSPIAYGWVGYAPLSKSIYRSPVNGGAKVVVWLAAIAVWSLVSAYLVRSKPVARESDAGPPQ
jgi:hypothetical protein